MNIILFDANSTSPVSGLIAVAPGECILINAWGLDAGETAQVFRAFVALGEIPEQSGVCEPPKKLTSAQQQSETAYLPCNVTVAVGETVDQNLTSLVLSQPGFYRLHLTPSALGTAVVEGVVLKGAEACAQAASQCCCVPETFFVATSNNPCLVITPGGEAGHRPVFDLDACCLLHAFPGLPVPQLTDELIVLSGGSCFRSTIAQVFDPAIICTTLGTYLLQLPAVGDTLVTIDAGLNCKRTDGETFVEFFETPWTGISINPFLTIAPGGINGHGPTFDYDLCADLQAIAPCACEPIPGDLIPIIRGGACQLAQFPEVDACTQFGLLPTGAILAGDQVVVRDVGGNCKLIDAADFLVTPFPLLAPDGTCASPSYSFTSSPDSGMFYDPAGLGSVVIGDDNCADFISIGASITIQTAASNVAITSGADITAVAAVDVTIAGANDANISATAGTARLLSAGGTAGVVADSAGNVTATNATGAALRVLVTGSILAMTAGLALEITTAGELLVNANPGVATEVLTSSGPGLPPVWAPAVATVAFPILAPDGSCAAPSYSFTNSPDSGMFYNGTAVVIGDDNCADFIEVGASINITSSASNIVLTANAGSVQVIGATALLSANAGVGVSTLNGGATLASTNGLAQVVSITGAVTIGAGTTVDITAGSALTMTAAAGNATVDASNNFIVVTAATTRLSIGSVGAWAIGGVVGAAGQVITSNGLGVPPTWQNTTTSFPLLAPDGTCAAPSYSFASSPDSGIFYDPAGVGSVIIGDDNCADFISIGASISIFSTASTVDIQGQGIGITSGLGLSLGSGGVPARLLFESDGSWNIGGSNGTAGQVITSNGAAAAPTWQTPTMFGTSMTWGVANSANAVDTRVIPPGYSDGIILNTDTPRGFAAPRAGTFSALFVRHQIANGNGNSITYTLRVNGVLTALTATLATGAVGQASDLVNSVAVAQGDLVEMVRIIPVAVGSAVLNAIISAQFN